MNFTENSNLDYFLKKSWKKSFPLMSEILALNLAVYHLMKYGNWTT